MKIIEQSQLLRKAKDKIFVDILKKYNLTSNELNIILFLDENTDDTATDIVNELLFAKSHVSYSIESLTQKGYVTKYIDENNKKIIHLKLTDKTIPILKETNKKNKEFIELICDNVSEEDKEVMKKVFKQMNENVNRILNS